MLLVLLLAKLGWSGAACGQFLRRLLKATKRGKCRLGTHRGNAERFGPPISNDRGGSGWKIETMTFADDGVLGHSEEAADLACANSFLIEFG